MLAKDTFIVNIKKLREKSGLTIEELSDKTGFSREFLIDFENGLILPSRNIIQVLIVAYNLDFTDQRLLYDLAALATHTVPLDVQDYLLCNPEVLQEVINKMLEQGRHQGNNR